MTYVLFLVLHIILRFVLKAYTSVNRRVHLDCCHELCVAACVKCRELFLNNFLNMALVVKLMQLTSRLLSGAVPGCDLLVLALSGVVPGVSWVVLGESSRAIRIGAAGCISPFTRKAFWPSRATPLSQSYIVIHFVRYLCDFRVVM